FEGSSETTTGSRRMNRHRLTFLLRRILLSAAMAGSVGCMVLPAQSHAETVSPAPGATQAGPASVADLAEGLLEAVVNISTSQKIKGTEGQGTVPLPQAPEGSPFQDFFDEFFKDREGGGGQQQ